MPDELNRSRVPPTYGAAPVRGPDPKSDPKYRYGEEEFSMSKKNRDLPNKGADPSGKPLTNRGGQPVEDVTETGETREPVDNRPAHPNFPGTVPDHQLPQKGNDDAGNPRK